MLTIILILGIILPPLIVPAVQADPSAKRIIIASIVSFFGIVLPLFVFFFSAFLVPEWKGGCTHGWLDCWHGGKLALTPAVAWALGALYAFENRMASRDNRGVVIGMWLGAMVAPVCFVYGLATVNLAGPGVMLCWLLVPGYMALWYTIRAIQMMRVWQWGRVSYLWTVCGSIPLWVASVFWSRHIYETLPTAPPSCFVVTAAARGHKPIVGPFFETQHHGYKCRANQQLLTLWQFEILWRARLPRSHASFRRAYNWCGPLIAAKIESPWLADMTWLALKPIEWFARIVIESKTQQGECHESSKMD